MKKVIVASTNPVKIVVTQRAFAAVFPAEEFEIMGIKSDSGVPEQPMGEETRLGARNRLAFVRRKHPNADFWVGQEGGLHKEEGRIFERAWIVVCDAGGFMAESSTAQFYLPKGVMEHIEAGMELGDAGDAFFNSVDSRSSIGVIGSLTDGVIDRTEYYLQAAIIALSEVKHQEWYK